MGESAVHGDALREAFAEFLTDQGEVFLREHALRGDDPTCLAVGVLQFSARVLITLRVEAKPAQAFAQAMGTALERAILREMAMEA